MYQLDWNIEFKNPNGKKYRLALLYSVEIESSVENLVDTAIITVPESILNTVLSIENKIPRGTEVKIELGYNGQIKPEFQGFVRELKNNNSTLTIECEDSIFEFRKPVANEVLKPTSISKIAQRLIDQCATNLTLSCDYDISYEKFVIHQANGFDVLKKLQEETKANIFVDNETSTLHIHAPFIEKSGTVKYSAQQNVQSISLEFKRATDRKFEITVQSVSTDGKVIEIKTGVSGGESVTMKVGPMSEEDMKKIGNAELSKRMADRFEGSIDTWLLPRIKPTATALYEDSDYPEKKGGYYVPSVKTSFSSSGAVRTINFGIKVS
jgi:hypothetical protein